MAWDDDEWLAEQATGCILALMWAAISAPIALLWQSSQTPAEEKIRKKKPANYFDHTIRGIHCPICNAVNEEGRWHCIQCNQALPNADE